MVDMFLLPVEVAEARARAGLEPEASALPGLRVLLSLVGRIIRVVKVQGALNSLWAA